SPRQFVSDNLGLAAHILLQCAIFDQSRVAKVNFLYPHYAWYAGRFERCRSYRFSAFRVNIIERNNMFTHSSRSSWRLQMGLGVSCALAVFVLALSNFDSIANQKEMAEQATIQEDADPVFVHKMPEGCRDWKLISVAHEEGNFKSFAAILGNDI